MSKSEIILFVLIACLCIVEIYIYFKIKKVKIEKQEEEQEKEKLIKEINQIRVTLTAQSGKLNTLNNEINNSNKTINEKKEQIRYINSTIERKRDQAKTIYQKQVQRTQEQVKQYKKAVNQAANTYIDNIQKQYERAEAAHAQKMASLKTEQDQAAAYLETIKKTRAAAYEALLKQQEVKQNKDNYRLIPSSVDMQDLSSLQKIKKTLHKPRILSMLIWQTYWQPLAKEKFPIILQNKTKTGIYKITNIQTNESYIGQSLDTYKRWCQHCKAGLGIDTPVGNKLYKSIQQNGLQNFTFELLCQCSKNQLNEKEKYFIELYQADTYGFNGTAGNK